MTSGKSDRSFVLKRSAIIVGVLTISLCVVIAVQLFGNRGGSKVIEMVILEDKAQGEVRDQIVIFLTQERLDDHGLSVEEAKSLFGHYVFDVTAIQLAYVVSELLFGGEPEDRRPAIEEYEGLLSKLDPRIKKLLFEGVQFEMRSVHGQDSEVIKKGDLLDLARGLEGSSPGNGTGVVVQDLVAERNAPE